MRCRACWSRDLKPVVDLGTAPPSNAFISEDGLGGAEVFVPLKTVVCTRCWLMQTVDYVGPDDVFTPEYAYFSSTSKSWLKHASDFVTWAIQEFDLRSDSFVVEVAANDGYLLQYVQEAGIGCLGIEPTASTAAAARQLGLETREEFLSADTGAQIAAECGKANLVVANNVLAHVPDPVDFVQGLRLLTRDDGVVSIEFPRVTKLVEQCQFDTIYHEHFSYFSLHSASRLLREQGLEIFEVHEIPTHGGSLRVLAQPAETGSRPVSSAVRRILDYEQERGIDSYDYYASLQENAIRVKNDLLEFLLAQKRSGSSVVAYGAAAKGNTLLNFAGVRGDLLPLVVDKSPGKLGKFLPGSRIPVVDEDVIRQTRPDTVLILPWNLREEIMNQLDYVRQWNGKFAWAIPRLTVSD